MVSRVLLLSKWKAVLLVGLIAVASCFALWYIVVRRSERFENIILALDSVIYGKHAIFYPSIELGFYAEEGINVTIVRGYGSADTIKKVDTGAATFGLADMSSLMISKSKGAKVKMLGMIHHISPMSIMCLNDSDINSPKDLEGCSLAGQAGDAAILVFPAFCERNDIEFKKVNIVVMDVRLLATALLTRQVDAIFRFYTALPSVESVVEQQGLSVKIIRFADFGFGLYGSGLIAADEFLQQNPDLVRRFIRATYKGIDWAIRNKENATNIFMKYQPELKRYVVAEELDVCINLFGPIVSNGTGMELGVMNYAKIKFTMDVISKYAKFDPYPIEDVFTNDFVELLTAPTLNKRFLKNLIVVRQRL